MQAFAYRHLVPAEELDVSITGPSRLRFPLKFLDSASVKIPAGGTARVRVRTPGGAFTNNFQLELNEPPDGITIASVSAEGTEAEILLHSDAAKTQAGRERQPDCQHHGQKGAGQPAGGKAQASQPRVAVGTLPAIPFEIVPLQAAD